MKLNQSALKYVLLIVAAVLTIGAASALAFDPEASGPDVYAVQAMLKSTGYYKGEIDGLYGPSTRASVQSYQRSAGLSVSGQVDTATLRSILQAYAGAKLSAGGTPNAPQGGASAPAQSGAKSEGLALSADEQQMIELVNQSRADANLPPLTAHPELSRVARFKSGDMAQNNYFSHDSPSFGSPFKMMTDFGISYRGAGENIACNQTVARAHEALMNSPGHRANILSTDFTHIGIGIVQGGQCGSMYTQMFLTP